MRRIVIIASIAVFLVVAGVLAIPHTSHPNVTVVVTNSKGQVVQRCNMDNAGNLVNCKGSLKP